MPLAGTGPILGALLKSAREDTAAAWRAALGSAAPSPADHASLRQQIAIAEGNAIINHIIAHGLGAVVVVSVAGVVAGPGVSGPGTGNLI